MRLVWEVDFNAAPVGGLHPWVANTPDGERALVVAPALGGGWTAVICIEERNAPEWSPGPAVFADREHAMRVLELAALGVRGEL